MAERVRRLNRHFREADVSAASGDYETDLASRSTQRIFHDGRFDRMGRLAGSAFWLNLAKEARAEQLRINGEPIATADISSAVPSIAYALKGAALDADPYCLPQLPEAPRDGVKIAFQQLVWDEYTPRSRLAEEARDLIPDKYSAKDVFDALIEANAPIRDVLGAKCPQGSYFLWHESEVIIDATLRAYGDGLTVLPIHDALIAPRSQAQDARAMLSDAFEARLGVKPKVALEDA